MEKARFQFSVPSSVDLTRSRCLDAIETLGWKVRQDLTEDYLITCYVPIPSLLPSAPVYSISLYPEDDATHLVLAAANDDLSQSHAKADLPKLRDTILTGRLAAIPPQGKCFISYRRYDSEDVVGRIYDQLTAAYGTESVFKDVDNIPIGADFRKVLDDAIGSCAVLLAVIGRDWLTVRNEQNQRRLDEPTDFVRMEIEAALRRGIPVIPLLVRGASMPREEDMPETLRELVYRNGVKIRSDPDFHRDMDRLILALNQVLGF